MKVEIFAGKFLNIPAPHEKPLCNTYVAHQCRHPFHQEELSLPRMVVWPSLIDDLLRRLPSQLLARNTLCLAPVESVWIFAFSGTFTKDKTWDFFCFRKIITRKKNTTGPSQKKNILKNPRYSQIIFRAEARTLTEAAVHIHIFMFWPTSFLLNQIQIDQFEKKFVGQNMNNLK